MCWGLKFFLIFFFAACVGVEKRIRNFFNLELKMRPLSQVRKLAHFNVEKYLELKMRPLSHVRK